MNRDRDAELRAWLRRGDPAATAEPSVAEISKMRARVVAAVEARRRSNGPAAPLAVLAAAALFAALLLWTPRREASGPRHGAAAAPAAPAKVARQIHFVTDGGTRVVWTLDPDLEL
jgi:hypothetical protein